MELLQYESYVTFISRLLVGMRKGAAPAQQAKTEVDALRETLQLLAMGVVAAPPLPAGCRHHVCIVHEARNFDADRVCQALRAALTEAFAGANVVFIAESDDPVQLAVAVIAFVCVVPYVTRGLLKAGSHTAAAVAAGRWAQTNGDSSLRT